MRYADYIFQRADYTVIPNELFDDFKEYTPSEWKVLCFIARNTLGWARTERWIKGYPLALNFIKNGCGLSKPTVTKALAGLQGKNKIIECGIGANGSKMYRAVLAIDAEYRSKRTLQAPTPTRVKKLYTNKINKTGRKRQHAEGISCVYQSWPPPQANDQTVMLDYSELPF